MKHLILCFGLLVLAILVAGCTTQPAQPSPTTPVATTAAVTPAFSPVPAPPSLTNTVWTLAWFDDTRGVWSKVADGSSITAAFYNEGNVTGSGGCNGYTTEYQLGNPDRIWFRRPVVPDHLCQTPVGVMSQESAFFTDLEWAETYRIDGNQLQIFDRTHKKILEFSTSPG